MKNRTKGEIKNSLQDLNPEDFPKARPSTPEDLSVDLGNIDFSLSNDKEVKRLEENSEGICKWMEEHLRKLDEIRKAPKAVRIRPENKKAAKEIRDKIDSFLNHPEAVYRQAAWVTFLTHKFNTVELERYRDALDFFDYMVEEGRLEKGNEHSPLHAWTKHFRIPVDACFTRPEFEKCKKALNELVNRVTQATAKKRDLRVSQLQNEANLEALEAFKAGQNGKALLYVPPQISMSPAKCIIRREGFLYIEVTDDGRIFPLEGIGSFEERVSEARSAGVFVKSYTLDWDWPPSKKKLAEAGLSDAQVDGVHFCWYLLKRAKDALAQTDQHYEEKLEMEKNVTISEDDFLLENREGDTLIDFEGKWETLTQEGGKTKREQTSNLFVMVRRNRDKVQIIGCPDHLKEFFSSCMEEYKEGEKFLGVPQPLQSVLQAQYSAVQTKSLLR